MVDFGKLIVLLLCPFFVCINKAVRVTHHPTCTIKCLLRTNFRDIYFLFSQTSTVQFYAVFMYQMSVYLFIWPLEQNKAEKFYIKVSISIIFYDNRYVSCFIFIVLCAATNSSTMAWRLCGRHWESVQSSTNKFCNICIIRG